MSAHAARPRRPGLLASWQPAALITGDVIALKLTLGVIALNRAGDYAHGAGDRYHMLESAFPLWVWCVWAYLVGACVLVGIAWRRHVLVWLGHGLGAGLYSILAVTALSAAFEGWPPVGPVASVLPPRLWLVMLAGFAVAVTVGAVTARGPLAPASWVAGLIGLTVIVVMVALAAQPADGIRGAGPMAVVALLHAILAARTAPRPLTDDQATVVEHTAAPERP